MSGRAHFKAFACACVVLGGLMLGEQAYLGLKAAVAERLIDRAFEAHLADGRAHRPWSWADTHPIARLEVPRLGLQRTVLAGAAGSSLAFGPGHIDGTPRPNRGGNCVLAGHRDSWFAFLERLQIGDELLLRTREGARRYRVARLAVRSMWDGALVTAPSERTRLTLVTCYPFGGLVGSTQRYVVICEPLAHDAAERAEAWRG